MSCVCRDCTPNWQNSAIESQFVNGSDACPCMPDPNWPTSEELSILKSKLPSYHTTCLRYSIQPWKQLAKRRPRVDLVLTQLYHCNVIGWHIWILMICLSCVGLVKMLTVGHCDYELCVHCVLVRGAQIKPDPLATHHSLRGSAALL